MLVFAVAPLFTLWQPQLYHNYMQLIGTDYESHYTEAVSTNQKLIVLARVM